MEISTNTISKGDYQPKSPLLTVLMEFSINSAVAYNVIGPNLLRE
jgi:hypothetical protein